ncbi:MAG TPA: RNA polymerase factor sigma-54 [Chloroflexota bacterium]|nr:RNA polymerase factor sigma-54 [Chloroflexota bacterium]
MELTQEASAQMGMKVSPRLVAASYILELSSQELQQAIAQELAENPALELLEKETCPVCGGPLQGSICPACLSQQKAPIATPDSDIDGSDDYVGDLSLSAPPVEDDFDPFTQVAAQMSLSERLLNDLQAMLPAGDMPIATYLVGNLNDNGYLQCSVEEAAHQLDVPVDAVERVLAALQSLEPIGIGARDLRECLLIQIAYLEGEGIRCPAAAAIVRSHLQELAEHKYNKIASELGLTLEEVNEASEFIRRRLNPYPAQGYGTPDPGINENRSSIVLPDVIITQAEKDTFEVEVIESKRFFLRITPLYQQLAARLEQEPDRFTDDEKRHIRQYVSRAKLFIANINQRRQTLQKITEYIVEAQKDFLLHGIRHLKPLTRAAVAYHLGMHESTVSRATASKYVMLPSRKVIPFSDFFTASLSVMDVIKELIASETSPLTDQEIADELARRGIVIARRTVAKYREQLGILPSSLR